MWRVHFDERPNKCVDCGDRFNCVSSLKTHYRMHKQQHWNAYASDDFPHNFPSDQEYVGNNKNIKNKEEPKYKL